LGKKGRYGPGQRYRAVHIHWVTVSAPCVPAAADSNASSQTSNCRTFSSLRSRPISSIVSTLLFRAPIEASCVAIPVATPSYSARSHIRAVPRPQKPLFLGAVVFLFGNGLASRSGGIVCARRRVGKCDQRQARRTDAGSNNSKEISPFHPIGSPSGQTALCMPIFASISQDACELAHIAARISQRDCACLPHIERQNNVENRAT
jgi:hypothetical protein